MAVDIVVFPGNPGMWCFYRKFIERMILKFGKHIHVHFINYHGHGIDTKTLIDRYGYKEEIIQDTLIGKNINMYKLSKKKNTHDINIYYNHEPLDDLTQHTDYSLGIVKHLLSKKSKTGNVDKTIVIGHSIGAYMALKSVTNFYASIDRVYLIAPVFEFIRETRGYMKINMLLWFKIFILIFARILVIFLRLISFIPMKLALDSDTSDLCQLIEPTNISNCADMAVSEFSTINGEYPRDIFLKDQQYNKIQIILSRDDVWNPKNYYKTLSYDENITKDNLHILKIDHTFVVDEVSYCKVVDKMVQIETNHDTLTDDQHDTHSNDHADSQSSDSSKNTSSINTSCINASEQKE